MWMSAVGRTPPKVSIPNNNNDKEKEQQEGSKPSNIDSILIC
jgi:hypothetical protein